MKEPVAVEVKEPVSAVPKNKRVKKSPVAVQTPAVLSLKTQNSIIRTVLDRLDGKSTILHGIDRSKS